MFFLALSQSLDTTKRLVSRKKYLHEKIKLCQQVLSSSVLCYRIHFKILNYSSCCYLNESVMETGSFVIGAPSKKITTCDHSHQSPLIISDHPTQNLGDWRTSRCWRSCAHQQPCRPMLPRMYRLRHRSDHDCGHRVLSLTRLLRLKQFLCLHTRLRCPQLRGYHLPHPPLRHHSRLRHLLLLHSLPEQCRRC